MNIFRTKLRLHMTFYTETDGVKSFSIVLSILYFFKSKNDRIYLTQSERSKSKFILLKFIYLSEKPLGRL